MITTTVDHKSANKFWPVGAEHKKQQCDAYALGDHLQGRAISGQFTFLVYVAPPGCETATLDVRRTRRSIGQVASYISNLQEVAAGITRGDFPARPSPLCGWCSACHACPEGLQWLRERGREPQPEIQRFMARTEGGQDS